MRVLTPPAGCPRRNGPAPTLLTASSMNEASLSAQDAGTTLPSDEGKYVYCIIKTTDEREIGPIGIGDGTNRAYTVPYRDLAAVVSDTPTAAARGRRAHLRAARQHRPEAAVSEMAVQYSRSRAAEHDARQELARLNVILENVSDPILVTDQHSNIILMNPEADRLFVAESPPQLAASVHALACANDTRFTTLISNFLLRTEQRQIEQITVVDPDTGMEFSGEVASSKLLNERASRPRAAT